MMTTIAMELLFCDEVLFPPPPAGDYYVESQDTSISYVTLDGKYYVRST